MAPFNMLSHATSWFLNLAESGYWTNCGFIRNADHVLQANCNPKTGKDANKERFQVLIQEYNQDFPHKKYTFGIAGRPGGPDWYINLRSNIRNHGPGGQGPEADPCFAELVSGEEAILKMHQGARESTSFQAFVDPVIFRSVRVITEAQEEEERANGIKEKFEQIQGPVAQRLDF